MRRFALLLALLLAGPAGGEESWGRKPYDEERPLYAAEVAAREREHARLDAAIQAQRQAIDSFLGSFWVPGRAAALEADYRRSSMDATLREDRHRQAALAARDAEGVYRRHLALGEDERSSTTRAALWYEHLDFLARREQAARLELAMLESRLVGLQGAAGIDWDGFWRENAEDLVFVVREVGQKLVQEVAECFGDLFRKSLTGAVTSTIGRAPTAVLQPLPEDARTLSDLVKVGECVEGPALRALVNALSAAWKKQFLDRLAGRVLPEVADYWWEHLVMAEEEERRDFAEKVRDELFGAEGAGAIVQTHVEESVVRQLLAREREEIQREVARRLPVGAMTPQALRREAEKAAVARTRGGIESTVKGAQLAVDYGSRLLLLWRTAPPSPRSRATS